METRGAHILIVDDDMINIKVLETALRHDYEIELALGGHEAISKVQQRMPDLILLDVMMPDLCGFDVCRILKSNEQFADIPIVFLTCMDTVEGETEGLEAGGIDYLSKPVNLSLVRLRVRNHLELKRRNEIIRKQCDLLSSQKKELEATLSRIKRLEGIISICMHCKKIRDDNDTWQQLEKYIVEHTDAQFTHGLCPNCFEEEMDRLRKQP